MKFMKSLGVGHWLATAALVTIGSSVSAAPTDWDLDALCTSNASKVVAGACGSNLTVTGGSTATGGVGATTSGSVMNAATVYDWGSAGLGVVGSNENSGDTGPHAADNRYGTDAFMFKFTNGPVTLASLTIGWNGTDNPTGNTSADYRDSDLTVYAWMGGNTPTLAGTNLTGTTTSVTSGWRLVSNYYDVGAQSGNEQNTPNSIYSSYWLISAYNSTFSGGTDDGNVDAFKLLALSTDVCAYTVTNNKCTPPGKAPEPGSLALVGVGLAGFMATRRRKQKSEAA